MNHEAKGDLVYVLHMRDAVRDARSHVSGMSLQAFLGDKKSQDAAARQLEILGEAANRVSSAFKQGHSNVPWSEATNMRNRLIHDYGHVDLLVVWETIKDDLPLLGRQLNDLLKEFEKM